jgi:hypothetical protein
MGQILYGLSLKLRIDVDEIRNWPYTKIVGWLAYLQFQEDKKEDEGE